MNKPNNYSMSQIQRILIVILAGITAVLGIWGTYNFLQNRKYRKTLELNYKQAVQETSTNLSNISTDLVKAMYCGTPAQLSQVSAKLWKEASSAKSAISSLPLAELHLDKTNQFLSQVGDYAMYLSQKTSKGQTISPEERQNFQRLREYADRLDEAVDDLEESLENGSVTLFDIEKMLTQNNSNNNISDENLPEIVTNTSLDAMEGGFSAYPTLVYDGPFSDHILDKIPEITKNSQIIDADTARNIAQNAVGANTNIQYMREENSNLPCFVFYSDECSIAVSKNGGKICYIICPEKDDISKNMTAKQAVSAAQNFLKKLGISSMKESYYEIDDGIITINFAHSENNVICYTDLIKISVRMDNGEVVMYDARGYLVNHKDRILPIVSVNSDDAKKSLSPQLTPTSSRLVLIPTLGQNEVLCWEFTCSGTLGDDILVYVNAQTAAEEQILILIEDDDGVLTK